MLSPATRCTPCGCCSPCACSPTGCTQPQQQPPPGCTRAAVRYHAQPTESLVVRAASLLAAFLVLRLPPRLPPQLPSLRSVTEVRLRVDMLATAG
jgi:hypothetical protein